MRRHQYVIRFRGARADERLFDEWEVRRESGVITISGDMDSAAVYGVLERIRQHGLELIELTRLPPPSQSDT